MKTKTWVILLGALMAVCLCLSVWLLQPGEGAAYAQIWSEGRLLYTVDLSVEQRYTVVSQYGTNVVTVDGGKIGVTEADCPDGYCMHRGFCSGGPQIVCLPNRLVIRFTAEQPVDDVAG